MTNNIAVTKTVTLTMRSRSTKWQAHIKMPGDKPFRFSTKTSDEEQARDIALQKEAEIKVLIKKGFPAGVGKTFKYAATRYREGLEKVVQVGTATPSQKTYLGILNKWIIPFFGDHRLDAIDGHVIALFDAHRKSEMGREPAKSTINQHNIVIRGVFEHAVHQKWCKKSDMPMLNVKKKGRKKEKRGYFEVEQFNTLMKFMQQWRDESDRYITRYKRDVLRYYVFFLVSTGMRAGKEVGSVKWENIVFFRKTSKKPKHYKIFLQDGKTDDREIVLRYEAYKYLESLKEMRSDVKRSDYVFCMPDRSSITGLPEMFRNCLTACGMRYSKSGKPLSLYSCRHTYATWKLQSGKADYR